MKASGVCWRRESFKGDAPEGDTNNVAASYYSLPESPRIDSVAIVFNQKAYDDSFFFPCEVDGIVDN
jgi:hypothetical protein